MTATLRDTLGKQRSPISEEEIRSLIESASDEFWCQGAGDVAIKVEENGHSKSLVLIKKPGVGFMLSLFEGGEQMIAISSDDYRETTVTSVGGEPWEVPVAFFIEPEKALNAAIEFYRRAEPTNTLSWVDFHEQSWTNKLT